MDRYTLQNQMTVVAVRLLVKRSTVGFSCACAVCRQGYYGANCMLECQCSNNGTCDPVTGQCNCSAGWTNQKCDQRQ